MSKESRRALVGEVREVLTRDGCSILAGTPVGLSWTPRVCPSACRTIAWMGGPIMARVASERKLFAHPVTPELRLAATEAAAPSDELGLCDERFLLILLIATESGQTVAGCAGSKQLMNSDITKYLLPKKSLQVTQHSKERALRRYSLSRGTLYREALCPD